MTNLFTAILNMSFSASIVALGIMLVRIPLKKAPKIYSYVLWSVVLFRLVCPFHFNSDFSLMPASANTVPQDIIYSQAPAAQGDVVYPSITAAGNSSLSANPVNSITLIQTVLKIAEIVWLLGFVSLLLYGAIGYISLKRRVCYATLICDNIYETDIIKTPFVFGLIRLNIYLPTTVEPAEYDYILKHEQTHIRRRDYLIKPFAFIVLALHWFNPVIWLSYFLMTKDMEMSCDEAVLREADGDIRKNYSEALLCLSTKRTSFINPLALGESNVKTRVKNVLHFKKPATWITVVSVLIVSVLIIVFITNRSNTDNNNYANSVDITEIVDEPIAHDMVFIEYASNDKAIFYYTFGLFVYDIKNQKIDRSINLREIGRYQVNGSTTVEVTVSSDGQMVYLRNRGDKTDGFMYQYDIEADKLTKTTLTETKDKYNVIPTDEYPPEGYKGSEGRYSHCIARIDEDTFAYLYSENLIAKDLQLIIYNEKSHEKKVYDVFQ